MSLLREKFVGFNEFGFMGAETGVEEEGVVKLRVELQLEKIEGFLGFERFSPREHDGKSVVFINLKALLDGVFAMIVQFEHGRNDIINLKIDLKCCYRFYIKMILFL